ncbi:MAG: carboxypeptidase regulatory-like domain-containing protein [Thermoanaerobaculia bacterium]
MAVPFRRVSPLLLFAVVLLLALPSFAQQTGGLTGRVTGPDGAVMPGVTVEARSTLLPQARVVTTSGAGEYRIPALPPGPYTVKFSLAGMQDATRRVEVLLGQDIPVNVAMGLAGVAESITVTADAALVEQNTTEVKSAVTSELIENLPIGQEYRDLVKLAPAVQYTEDATRGPSAGGSGQDNVYQFDGVNVTLPLFGTLAAEPATHDIQQIAISKGGAKAIDFNRAAGFTIDSVSKSGTSDFKGEVGYQFQTEAMRGDVTGSSIAQNERFRDWLTANLGGPILQDRLYFYGSYYRPTVELTKRTNAYGDVPDYESTRDEFFGKLTLTPISTLLINGSYRSSDREGINASIGTFATPSSATDEESQQKVAILEASWVINGRNYISGKFTDYGLETLSVPHILVDAVPTTTLGTHLDFNNPTQYGRFIVPNPVTGATAYNAFIQPMIDKYGYINSAGVRTGGGSLGAWNEINDQDFFRKSAQLGYDVTVGSEVAHDIHVGYMWSEEAEDLIRSSNGWGSLSVVGGRINCPTSATACAGKPYYYLAQFTRSALGGVGGNLIHSEYVQHNIEINDTIRWNNWSFNVGLMASNDTLYGQGLKEDSSTVSGYVGAPGNKYEMYDIGWEKTLAPRLGATWSYNGVDNVYASYARYVPAASSLPRAASWDRSILGLTSRAYFDENGNIIGSDQVGSSSGKFFVEDMDPRYTDEYLIGTSQQITSRIAARGYVRYRYSTNFWEDTNNDARQRWAPEGYPKDLYIPDLAAWRAQVGGSSYVIAELDGAFTKHYEATFETDWRGDRASVKGSYTWSHYYGNFDQDNTTTSNDAAVFMGSSFLADGVGTQIWDNKYGDLRGDRRHLLKVFGSYNLAWNGTVGAYAVYQSGQPWEMWSYEPYRTIPGFSGLNDINRYAEPAGSRRSPAHYQVDLTYSQNVPIRGYNLQFQLDAFNVLDNQTGYNYQPAFHASDFGRPRDYFDPRRYQASVKFQF